MNSEVYLFRSPAVSEITELLGDLAATEFNPSEWILGRGDACVRLVLLVGNEIDQEAEGAIAARVACSGRLPEAVVCLETIPPHALAEPLLREVIRRLGTGFQAFEVSD